jgi:hypothetical protein
MSAASCRKLGMTATHLIEDRNRSQPWCCLQKRHNLAVPERFQRVGTTTTAWLSLLRGHPGIGVQSRAGTSAEAGLGGGGLASVGSAEVHVQFRLLIGDVFAGHGDLVWGD